MVYGSGITLSIDKRDEPFDIDKMITRTDPMILLNHPQFVCSLDDLSRGIVKSVCVNENTKKYLPNEQNAEKFERLKWK